MNVTTGLRNLARFFGSASQPGTNKAVFDAQSAVKASSVVQLSAQGKALASSEAGGKVSATAITTSARANALREEMKKYDFTSITPNQMSQLTVKLYSLNELPSTDVTGAFIGIETNSEPPMDPNKPINLIAHFDKMYNNVKDAAATDSSLSFSVEYYGRAKQMLNDLVSFAGSSREHITNVT